MRGLPPCGVWALSPELNLHHNAVFRLNLATMGRMVCPLLHWHSATLREKYPHRLLLTKAHHSMLSRAEKTFVSVCRIN